MQNQYGFLLNAVVPDEFTGTNPRADLSRAAPRKLEEFDRWKLAGPS